MREVRFSPGWLKKQVSRSVAALSHIPREYGGTAPTAIRPPMESAQITGVVESILDDYLGDSEPPERHREIAEALTESWLKDRRRALNQAARSSGSNSGGPS